MSSMTHKLRGSLEMLKKYFLCPICVETTHGPPTIFCEICECWIHYECIGITANHPLVINTHHTYICYKCTNYGESKLRDHEVVIENKKIIDDSSSIDIEKVHERKIPARPKNCFLIGDLVWVKWVIYKKGIDNCLDAARSVVLKYDSFT